MVWCYSTGLISECSEERKVKEREIEVLVEYVGVARYADCRTPGV
jgi:hypothetical protein